MRHSVTWLNSRWWLVACYWLMSLLCRTIRYEYDTIVILSYGRREIFGGGVLCCTEHAFQGNGFELILANFRQSVVIV